MMSLFLLNQSMLNIVKAKALPIMLPVNVPSIMLKLRNVTGMIIILNAMLRLGVSKTVIIQHHVLSRTMLTSLVLVTVPFTKVVKETMTAHVRKPVLPKLVRQVRSLKRTPAAAPMILLTEHVASHPVVRLILRCPLHLMARTVPTAASMPATTPAT